MYKGYEVRIQEDGEEVHIRPLFDLQPEDVGYIIYNQSYSNSYFAPSVEDHYGFWYMCHASDPLHALHLAVEKYKELEKESKHQIVTSFTPNESFLTGREPRLSLHKPLLIE